MKNFKIKSYCKINLYLKIVKKLSNNYHNIISLITFCHLCDIITISELRSNKDKVNFSGKYRNGINKIKNTVTKLLYSLRKMHRLENQFFKINVQKNIPHGSGLGSGSSNAATLLNYLNKEMNLKLNKNKLLKISNKIGFDVPINLERKNVFLTGKKDKILRLRQKFRLNILILYPNIKCSTQKIYQSNKQKSYSKIQSSFLIKNKVALINFLKNEQNDLEKNVVKFYPKIKKIINTIKSQKGCHFSRITGSGSACIGIFSTMKNAISAKKLIKLKYPKYWCDVSKTI